MALGPRNKQFLLNAGILLVLLASILSQPVTAFALGDADAQTLPNFSDFSLSVQNGRADDAAGVYVTNQFALPVVQQPYGSPGYVSREDGNVTQFRMANQYGNVGLLAHNFLSGKAFFDLEIGDEVRLVHGDGRV